jgi:hypothetical protein
MTRPRNVAIVASLLFLAAGIPLTVFGLPMYVGPIVAAILIAVGIAFRLAQILLLGEKTTRWELGMCIYVGYCIAVSLFSNTVLYPQSWDGWVPALYVLMPLLVILPFTMLDVAFIDGIDAIVLVAIAGSLLVIVDHIYPLAFLDQYRRVAVADPDLRRIVLVKTEMAFAFVVSFARLLDRRKTLTAVFRYAGSMIVIGFALFVISEGRLPISATVIGCAIYIVFFIHGKRKLAIVPIISVLMVIIAPLALEKYIDYVIAIGDLRQNDPSVSYRMTEYGYLKVLFDQTSGVGFGIMSQGGDHNTLLSFAAHYGGYLSGAGRLPVELADIGLFAALFQFGYLGFILVVCLTITVIRTLWKISRKGGPHPYKTEIGALAAVTIAFLISPLPMNFFSLDWTVQYGGLLWFLSSRAATK